MRNSCVTGREVKRFHAVAVGEGPNLIKIRSLIAPGFAMSRIYLCATQPAEIKDRVLIRLRGT